MANAAVLVTQLRVVGGVICLGLIIIFNARIGAYERAHKNKWCECKLPKEEAVVNALITAADKLPHSTHY
nr:hypothetical protein [Nostoc sp. EfeVER01]